MLDKNLIKLLNIRDEEYSQSQLEKTLILIIKNQNQDNKNRCFLHIGDELKVYLNYHSNNIKLKCLIRIIMDNYLIKQNYPKCNYLSYDQKPDYAKLNENN
jgi:hypothetical protein